MYIDGAVSCVYMASVSPYSSFTFSAILVRVCVCVCLFIRTGMEERVRDGWGILTTQPLGQSSVRTTCHVQPPPTQPGAEKQKQTVSYFLFYLYCAHRLLWNSRMERTILSICFIGGRIVVRK